MQLNHPGRQSPKGLSSRVVAPSAVPIDFAGAFAMPRALTAEEILELVARFAESARIVVDAGFDGVQLHGAHGYLISQFLSPAANQRDDEWGGDPRAGHPCWRDTMVVVCGPAVAALETAYPQFAGPIASQFARGCGSCAEFLRGSPFLRHLYADGHYAVPGVT